MSLLARKVHSWASNLLGGAHICAGIAHCSYACACGACRELGGQLDTDGRPPDRLLWAVNTFGEARVQPFRELRLMSLRDCNAVQSFVMPCRSDGAASVQQNRRSYALHACSS